MVSSLLAAASAGPILVNVNGIFLPQQYGSSPYPTAYGYAAGPAYAVHLPQVRALPGAFAPVVAAPVAAVPAVKSAPVEVVAIEAAPAVALAAAPVAAVNTVAVAAVKAVAAVPAVTSSQYHAQDEAGNYKYGYNNINSAKEAAGNVHDHYEAGYYSTQDRTVQYVADSNGFREV